MLRKIPLEFLLPVSSCAPFIDDFTIVVTSLYLFDLQSGLDDFSWATTAPPHSPSLLSS